MWFETGEVVVKNEENVTNPKHPESSEALPPFL